jgi:hypothetical protein
MIRVTLESETQFKERNSSTINLFQGIEYQITLEKERYN